MNAPLGHALQHEEIDTGVQMPYNYTDNIIDFPTPQPGSCPVVKEKRFNGKFSLTDSIWIKDKQKKDVSIGLYESKEGGKFVISTWAQNGGEIVTSIDRQKYSELQNLIQQMHTGNQGNYQEVKLNLLTKIQESRGRKVDYTVLFVKDATGNIVEIPPRNEVSRHGLH